MYDVLCHIYSLSLSGLKTTLKNLADLAIILQNITFVMSQYNVFYTVNNLEPSLSFAILEHLWKVHLWLAV